LDDAIVVPLNMLMQELACQRKRRVSQHICWQ
jgi:hypothetical protein